MSLWELFDEFEKYINQGWQFYVEGQLTNDINKIKQVLKNEKVLINYYPELMIIELQLPN